MEPPGIVHRLAKPLQQQRKSLENDDDEYLKEVAAAEGTKEVSQVVGAEYMPTIPLKSKMKHAKRKAKMSSTSKAESNIPHQQGACSVVEPTPNRPSHIATNRGLAKNRPKSASKTTCKTQLASHDETINSSITPSSSPPRIHSSTKAGLSRKRKASKATVSSQEQRRSGEPSMTSVTSPAGDGMETENLAVAKAVKDDEEMPVAHQMIPHSEGQQRRVALLRTVACVAGGLGLLLVGVAVLVVVLQQNRSSETHTHPGDASSSIIIEAPVSLKDYLWTQLPTYSQNALNISFSQKEIVNPQSQALEWLLEDPYALNYTTPELHQRFALASFFYATNGFKWRRSKKWLEQDSHECDWYSAGSFSLWRDTNHSVPDAFIYPTLATGPCDHTGDDDESVVGMASPQTYQHLWLSRNQLHGSLVPELALLTSLKSVALHINNLYGSIPSSWFDQPSACTHLEALSLARNQLTGIPTNIGHCTNLQTLALSNNPFFNTTIASQLGNLHRLKHLVMNENNLLGRIPSELGLLTNLGKFLAGLHIACNW